MSSCGGSATARSHAQRRDRRPYGPIGGPRRAGSPRTSASPMPPKKGERAQLPLPRNRTCPRSAPARIPVRPPRPRVAQRHRHDRSAAHRGDRIRRRQSGQVSTAPSRRRPPGHRNGDDLVHRVKVQRTCPIVARRARALPQHPAVAVIPYHLAPLGVPGGARRDRPCIVFQTGVAGSSSSPAGSNRLCRAVLRQVAGGVLGRSACGAAARRRLSMLPGGTARTPIRTGPGRSRRCPHRLDGGGVPTLCHPRSAERNGRSRCIVASGRSSCSECPPPGRRCAWTCGSRAVNRCISRTGK